MRALRRWVGTVVRALPEPLMLRVAPGRLGYGPDDIPLPLAMPNAPVRLLVAPANSAEQGHAWARAAERLPGVSAANLAVQRASGLRFRADQAVSSAVFVHSRTWGRAHVAAVADQVTHVLVESERAVLGSAFGGDLRAEADWFDAHDIARAYVAHGSDLRLPSRHADLDELSPFRDAGWEQLESLERAAQRNGRFLSEQGEHPLFVATTDLLHDVPRARWLPNVVEPAKLASDTPVLENARPVVLHAPTNERIKGTLLVRDSLDRLNDAGVIDLRLERTDPAGMPAQYRAADIVLDQFRLGIYSTTAIEAMAAGRLVVARVSAEVRETAERAAGMPLPIVDAHPDDLEEVLLDIVTDRDRYREIARSGPAYVSALHDGTYSARVLAPFLAREPG